MSSPRHGSGVRYQEYRRAFMAGQTEGAHPSSSRRGQPRHRSVRELIRVFWTLLGGVRWTVAVAVAAITISAALRLIPPAATGFALDHVLGHRDVRDWHVLYETRRKVSAVSPLKPETVNGVAIGSRRRSPPPSPASTGEALPASESGLP